MARTQFVFILLALFMFKLSETYKILVVFPFPSKSHAILGDAFVKTLLEVGHEVTYVTAMKINNTSPKLRQIDVSSNFDVLPAEHILNIEKILKKEVDLFELSAVFKLMSKMAASTLMNPKVQELLHDTNEDFDAVIIEWMYTELYSGIAAVFDCPMIWSSSMDPHYLVLSLIDEDTNPVYTSDVYSSIIPPYSFSQRVWKLWSYIVTRFKKWLIKDDEIKIYEEAYTSALAKRGRQLPVYDDLIYNGSLMFGNSHVSAGQSLKLPQNYVPIAGYHIDLDIKPLPKDLQAIMDVAEHGVIYFSMGSILKSTQVPLEIKKGLLSLFAKLKQTVIWKFEEQLQNVSKNLHIVKWAPQQSILAHPNCVLFITHGGLLSTLESLHFGVPIIGIPMFADQFNNVNRAVDKGFAKRVDLDHLTPVNLEAAIEDILENPIYHERVKEWSFVYHDRPVQPRHELVHWVEHVVRTRGATHLRSPALRVRWYQKMYLDLAVLTTITLASIVLCFKRLSFKNAITKEKKIN